MGGPRLPTYESCKDSDDPEVMLQWLAVNLPFAGDQGYTPSNEQLKAWSKRWVEAGVVIDPARRKIKLVPPYRGQQHSLNGSSMWVPIDQEEPPPAPLPNMAEYTRHEQEFVAEDLRYHGVIETPVPEVDKAEVITEKLFDPADHTPSTVKGYLMGANEMERRRVIAAEQTGKCRQQILNAYPGL